MIGLFISLLKSGQYHQQPGNIFPVSLVSYEQQAGQSSPAHAGIGTGEVEHQRWFILTNISSKIRPYICTSTALFF